MGELAKKMGVTVRTMQHYDKEGFFSPFAESDGGRRLYTDKDLIKLYQILSLKHLGFSLEYTKIRIISLDTKADVANVPPNSETAQSLAKVFWELVMEFTAGDMSILPSLMKLGEMNESKTEWEQKQALVNAYIEKALDVYFAKLGVDPLEEELK